MKKGANRVRRRHKKGIKKIKRRKEGASKRKKGGFLKVKARKNFSKGTASELKAGGFP